jgi:hypothetical protein
MITIDTTDYCFEKKVPIPEVMEGKTREVRVKRVTNRLRATIYAELGAADKATSKANNFNHFNLLDLIGMATFLCTLCAPSCFVLGRESIYNQYSMC